MDVYEALDAISLMPSVYVLSIVNAEHIEIPIEFIHGKEYVQQRFEDALQFQRALDVPDPNYRVRVRNHKGTVVKSKAI